MKANRDTISPEFSFDFEKRSRILIFPPGYASSVYTCLIDNKNNFKLLHIFSYSFEYYYYFPFLKFEHRVSAMKSTRNFRIVERFEIDNLRIFVSWEGFSNFLDTRLRIKLVAVRLNNLSCGLTG